MSRAARRPAVHDDEHENHERWLVSYADMITVLMALFIVLFAVSQVDAQKFVELRNGLADGFGSSDRVPVPGGTGILEAEGQVPDPLHLGVIAAPRPMDVSPVEKADEARAAGPAAPIAEASATEAAARAEVTRLKEIERALSAALAAQGLGDRVDFRVTERGLVAAIVADDVFFDSASAEIQPTGLRVLDSMTPTLRRLPENIAVEGHANHLTISSPVYPTNWELSAGRAAGVVRHLASGGVTPSRLAATGFGDARPLFPVDSPRALTGNRRVDLVVLSNQPAEVRALLPLLAGEPG